MSERTLRISVPQDVKAPRWPNYLLPADCDGDDDPKKVDVGLLKVDVGLLTDEQIEELCEDFREHCRSRRPF